MSGKGEHGFSDAVKASGYATVFGVFECDELVRVEVHVVHGEEPLTMELSKLVRRHREAGATRVEIGNVDFTRGFVVLRC
jgi:hypothetical protein